MTEAIRTQFNAAFTEEKYKALLAFLERKHPGDIGFRVAETPVFLSRDFKDKLIEAAESIWEFLRNDYVQDRIQNAVPLHYAVPEQVRPCEMVSFDFGICLDENGEYIPQLIEFQGFPTLFYWQLLEAQAYRQVYGLPDNLTNFFNGYDDATYLQLLRDIILNGHQPENVVLLDILPEKQKTRIDFKLTEDHLGIRTVDISELYEEDNRVFYSRDGVKTHVARIYNRMIFDDFEQHKDRLSHYLDFTKNLDVEWLPHPSWFFRYSKYAMPLLAGKYVPETHFLNELQEMPPDLENYVLKPLFSFAGQGVIIDVTKENIDRIEEPGQWILQKKVTYAPSVDTPDGRAKCEIRLMFFLRPGETEPVLVNNLVRISKGQMVGVRYNVDKTWVGSSIAFFEK